MEKAFQNATIPKPFVAEKNNTVTDARNELFRNNPCRKQPLKEGTGVGKINQKQATHNPLKNALIREQTYLYVRYLPTCNVGG